MYYTDYEVQSVNVNKDGAYCCRRETIELICQSAEEPDLALDGGMVCFHRFHDPPHEGSMRGVMRSRTSVADVSHESEDIAVAVVVIDIVLDPTDVN